MKTFRHEFLDSTNSEAARKAYSLEHGDVIIADGQTAGRGQRGNSWESAPGMNLTFSLFLKPEHLAASDSFLLSMAVSIGIVEALNDILKPEQLKIKWPNDIYWNDLKLAGILIENSLNGSWLKHSIVGIGLNVNQKKFVSDAPNPVSMTTVSGGNVFDKDIVLEKIHKAIMARVNMLSENDASGPTLLEIYHKLLWRNSGLHKWREPGGNQFIATIYSVDPTGLLTLLTDEGQKKSYLFKEIFPVL